MAIARQTHQWKFTRYGGLDQVVLETADDLLNLEQLDPKLWAAMVCPTDNIEFDTRTLEYLDSDNDHRVKIPEILAGLKWICSILKKPELIIKPSDSLPIEALNSESEEGKAIIASIKMILSNLEKPDEKQILLSDLAGIEKVFAAQPYNGDGIITVDTPASPAAKKLIAEIIDCIGSVEDRSGKPGISKDLVDTFVKDVASYSSWRQKAQDDEKIIMFAGEDTSQMADQYLGVKAKIDDYFTRCRLAAFDARYAQAGTALEQEYLSLLKKSLSSQTQELRELPLALVDKEAFLMLKERVNPAWAMELAAFADQVVQPIVGESEKLSEEKWMQIKNKFVAYESWLNQKAGASVEKLGIARVKDLLESAIVSEVRGEIAMDKAQEPEFAAITTVDKLVRFYLYLYTLLNNFTAFRDFYDVSRKAIFQIGTLYMDSRSCDLCVKVDDLSKHSSMANSCNTFLIYCNCVRLGTSEKMTIAVAFTDGDSDQLLPGRNGLFVDRKGCYWDATIVKIIDHPISIRQAFWSPYKRMGRMINEQIEKFAVAKDQSANASLTGAKISAAAPKTPPPAPFDVGKFAGIFAAIGLALAAMGSTIASLVAGFMNLAFWQMPIAVAGILLLISGPSMIIAALRLRRRNLGAILDANGWAVNTRAQINLTFGKTLTKMAELPAGSTCSLHDPFAEKKASWKLYLLLLIVIIIALLIWRPSSCNIFKSFCGIVPCKSEAVKTEISVTAEQLRAKASKKGLASTNSEKLASDATSLPAPNGPSKK